MDSDDYVLWLSLIDGISRKNAFKLLDYFHHPEKIWNADKKTLLESQILLDETANKIVASKKSGRLDKELEGIENLGGKYISIFNPAYPKLLREIDDPPLGLYVLGEMPDEKYEKIAIIGARRCTSYGSLVSEKLAKDLAKRKVVVVSGMARGIDSRAHLATIEAGSKTIAVLGCGIDTCYPPENRGLMEKIIKNGCVISEYPLKTPPLGAYFPQRNRIISGLSKGVIVVEAEQRSGTLITVQQALDNGRTVFAVPGNITNVTSEGTNQLIKDGAPVVTCADDIFFELNIEEVIETDEKIDDNFEFISKNLDKDEKKVYDSINLEGVDVEIIANNVDDSIQNIQYILTMLELKGYIRKIPGEKYIREI